MKMFGKVSRAVCAGCLLLASVCPARDAAQTPGSTMPTVLYGAAYYNEYTPAALQPNRLATDVAMMKAAGFTVVRMGESTWSLWEPTDGKFEYAWMDRVVDAMAKAGIKVILGTPTYSIPVWMYKAHPEILARPLGGGYVGYGMRQNMDYDNPVFRNYAQRLIIHLVEHYKSNPDVIGWQVDNETGAYGASNDDVFHGFVAHLQAKYGTTDLLNKDWFLNYWGQDVNTWADMPTRDNATSTSYKLEWTRYSQKRVTNYLAWQAQLVRDHRRADQFVTQDFASIMRSDVNEPEVVKAMDVVADNVYHGWQDKFDGEFEALQGDLARSLKHGNYLVTELNAQTLGWDSASQYPPYDGQLRLDAYSDISSGANMVEYWHWSSISAGQETFWGGILSHDLGPNRIYREATKVGAELQRIGPELANLQVHNKVAILYSVDSSNAISFMPYKPVHQQSWTPGEDTGLYDAQVQQLHKALYAAQVDADFVFPETQSFSQYKLLIIPSLYIADDALLKRITEYVAKGGHVLMLFKSGFANENSAVRWQLAPGPLSAAAGFTYQEYSNLAHPLALKGDPFGAGKENSVTDWAEFLQIHTAQPLAFYDDPFYGQWPAITRNSFGDGTLTYEGTALSAALQNRLVLDELRRAGLTGPDQNLHPGLHVKHCVDSHGSTLHFYLNYTSASVTFTYPYAAGSDLLTGRKLLHEDSVTVEPWGLLIAKEQ